MIKAAIIILLACASVFAQTKDDLRKKYNEPISETFVVRTGVTVTATYTPTGQIKELLIAPQLPSDLIKSKGKTLSYDSLKEIIDELVPPKVRGKQIGGTFFTVICLPSNDCGGSFVDYENLTIYYNAGNDGANYAVIQWRKIASEK
jgi:hypothetical protein